ncbi:TetR family transcriptional regulator [Archangium violaceum]|uniref:TetR/AcrR family transcriptional regulator n=1 Tax=Archangium violaceum TaxID=83451 RepID=UPI001950A2B3|nr:TetR/AcrR family transcriptional regulator [Archangium violaceum]QRO01899.1 TetR family transcriptional regulator [Archangium violaceum]
MSSEPGLRERKKRETRRLLAEVATRLFAERGFDEVTVADIAAAANVSDKTVFNYFATKEDLVLNGREEIEAELIQAVRERELREPVLAVVRRHTLAVAERMNALPAERRAAFRKVVQSTPSVHARIRQMSLQSEEQLARILAEQTGASAIDPTPRVVASIIGVLTRLGYGVTGWPEGKRRSHAETLASIATAFDLCAQGLAEYGARGQP